MTAARAGQPASDGHLRVTQVRSGITTKPKHRGTLRALGLRGVGRSRILPDRPEVRGMLARVPHLVTVEEADQAAADEQRQRSAAARRARRAAEGRAPGAGVEGMALGSPPRRGPKEST